MVNNIMLSVMAWGSALRDAITNVDRDESGQDLIEYVVLAGFISLAAAVAFVAVGPLDMTTFATDVTNCLTLNGNCGT